MDTVLTVQRASELTASSVFSLKFKIQSADYFEGGVGVFWGNLPPPSPLDITLRYTYCRYNSKVVIYVSTQVSRV